MWLHHRDLRKSDPLKLSTQPLAQQKFPCQKSLTPSFSRIIGIIQPKYRLEGNTPDGLSAPHQPHPPPGAHCQALSIVMQLRDTRIRTCRRWDKTRSYSQSSTSCIEGLSQLMCFTLGSRPSPPQQDSTDPVRR